MTNLPRYAPLGCLLLALAMSIAPGARAAPNPSQWSDKQGPATSARLINACLERVQARTPRLGIGLECVDAAFDACLSENGGNMSQYDMNVCRGHSMTAWKARYDDLMRRLAGVFRRWATEPRDDWRVTAASRFRDQERTWSQWVRSDCEFRNLGSVGGSIHSYSVSTCEERHMAFRVIDLAPLVEWWEDH